MKKIKEILTIYSALALAQAAFSQGRITFLNRAGNTTTAYPGQVLAPVYREDPADPTHRISGNTPTGVPSGTTSYNGAPVVAAGQGPTFTATLWGLNSLAVTGNSQSNNLMLLQNGTTTFRTDMTGNFAGIWVQLTDSAIVSGVQGASADRATFQVRVWDTRNGAIATWDEVWLPENNGVLRGYSEIFTDPWMLGDPTFLLPPPTLQGLESFNVFIVPEPSVLVLGVLVVASLAVFRLRKSRERSE